MKIYKAKTLFQGYNIGLQNSNSYVGVPGKQNYPSDQNFENERNFEVVFDGRVMKIRSWKKASAYYTFKDLKGRGDYQLGYFEWKPKEPEVILSPMAAMANSPLPDNWEDTRKKLHG